MQKKCRSLLINAIAHERMTPLHQIIGISRFQVEGQEDPSNVNLNPPQEKIV